MTMAWTFVPKHRGVVDGHSCGTGRFDEPCARCRYRGAHVKPWWRVPPRRKAGAL